MEDAWFVSARNHAIHDLRTWFDSTHSGRIDLCSVGVLKAPIAIDTPVVIHKYSGVKAIDAIHLYRVIGIPVTYLKRPVRTVAFSYQTIAVACLVVGEQVIGLLARTVCYQCDIWCIQHVSSPCRVKRLAFGILVYHEDNTIVAPLAQILNGSRPHHLVSSAISCYQIIVRTIYIYALLSWIVRIIEYIRLTIGYMFPKGKIRVTNGSQLRLLGLCLLGTGYSHQRATCCCNNHA